MPEDTHTISIARDFSRSPGGRYTTDGSFSGQRFRDEVLLPALRNRSKVEVNLNGTRGYGSSFLEEAFGGAVREGFTPAELRGRLSFVADDPSLIDEIWEYIDDAGAGEQSDE